MWTIQSCSEVSNYFLPPLPLNLNFKSRLPSKSEQDKYEGGFVTSVPPPDRASSHKQGNVLQMLPVAFGSL